ncbi:MAG: hypothetical protein SOY97_06110 [Candidatus Metalachnospira sp.]|nr:hypothetical protein [Candidatus Metalachnospira sp.]
MNALVSLKGNEAFTDSMIIAEGTGNDHNAVQQLISTYENDFRDFGKLAFEMRPMLSGQKVRQNVRKQRKTISQTRLVRGGDNSAKIFNKIS